MMFWAIAAILALGCGALMVAALLRARGDAVPPAAYDLDVYRVQLKEVEKDLARGVLTPAEAERVRTEISRRILSADTALRRQDTGTAQGTRGAALLAGILLLVVTGGALAGYLLLGAPGYADMPREKRLAASDAARADRLPQAEAVARFGVPETPAPAQGDFAELMERLRIAVEARPDDPRGLALLARNEAAMGNISAALDAQARLIEVLGPEAAAAQHAFLADLMIAAAGGYVSAEAETALRTALSKNADQPEALYYLGVYYDQVDRPDAAFRTWEKLLRDSPPGAAWTAQLRRQIVSAADRAGIRYSLPPETAAPGPGAADMEAAGEMTEDERAQMIRGMVDGLMTRLSDEGGPPEDWARLIGALTVLGEVERAEAIRSEALTLFKDDPAASQTIREAGAQPGGAAQ